LRANDQEIERHSDLSKLIRSMKAGDKVTLEIIREGKSKKAESDS